MNRAVEAKLKNPHLSLLEALRIGGFHYPPTATASVVDDEQVTLSQRKNQLSRRLRYARQQQSLQQQPQPQISSSPLGSVAGAVMMEAGDWSPDFLSAVLAHQHHVHQTPSAPITTKGFVAPHDVATNQHSVVLDPRLMHQQTQHAMDETLSLEAHAPELYFQLLSLQSLAPIPAPHASQAHHPDPMDLFLLSPHEGGTFSLTDQSMTLVDTITGATAIHQSHPSSLGASVAVDAMNRPTQPPEAPSANVEDFRLQMALQVLGEQTKGLYCRAMLSAGYSWEEVQDTSPAYRQFVLQVCEKERERLHQLLSG